MNFKAIFAKKELSEFWFLLRDQYPELSKRALISLLAFGSSYLCEHGFSALTEIKCKKRERMLMLDDELRVCLTNIELRLDLICQQKQAHPSH